MAETEEPDAGADVADLDRPRTGNPRSGATTDRAGSPLVTARSATRRTAAAVVLVVLGATTLPVGVVAVWIRNQLLDTDRYVATVEPLASDPTIRSALVDRISTRIAAELDIESLVREELPASSTFLAPPIAAGAESLIRQAATRVVESEQFAELWADANRRAHGGLVFALTGREGEVLSTSDGTVVVRLGAVVTTVLERVDARFGSRLSDRVPADRLDVEFVLIDAAMLSGAQAVVRWLDRLAWFLPLLTLALLAGAIAVSPSRARGVLFVGLGVTVSMLVMRLAIGLGRDLYLTSLPDAVERADAAAVVFDTLTRHVLQATRVVFLLGLVMVITGWLMGRSAAAVAVRTAWVQRSARASSSVGPSGALGPGRC